MNAVKPSIAASNPSAVGQAGNPAPGLATRAKIVLSTTDGVKIDDSIIVAQSGVVTLRGAVETETQKERAQRAVRGIDGVKGVRNYLRVVPARPADQKIKERVEEALRSEKTLDGLKVASVHDGVVRMAGKGVTMTDRLRAIEVVWNMTGLTSEGADRPDSENVNRQAS